MAQNDTFNHWAEAILQNDPRGTDYAALIRDHGDDVLDVLAAMKIHQVGERAAQSGVHRGRETILDRAEMEVLDGIGVEDSKLSAMTDEEFARGGSINYLVQAARLNAQSRGAVTPGAEDLDAAIDTYRQNVDALAGGHPNMPLLASMVDYLGSVPGLPIEMIGGRIREIMEGDRGLDSVRKSLDAFKPDDRPRLRDDGPKMGGRGQALPSEASPARRVKPPVAYVVLVEAAPSVGAAQPPAATDKTPGNPRRYRTGMCRPGPLG